MKLSMMILFLSSIAIAKPAKKCPPGMVNMGGVCHAAAAETPKGDVCAIDAEKHCSGFTPADGLHQCLSDHKHELSQGCAASLTPEKKK